MIPKAMMREAGPPDDRAAPEVTKRPVPVTSQQLFDIMANFHRWAGSLGEAGAHHLAALHSQDSLRMWASDAPLALRQYVHEGKS